MAEITIDRTTFPAEGGEFTINITKDDPWVWGAVTIPAATWYEVVSDKTGEVSNYLYRVTVDVQENATASTRAMSISVAGDGHSELFTITQSAGGGSVSAEIISYAPTGNISSNGGTLVVDIYANGGTDSLTTASVSSGTGVTLTSTQHGVSSGGYTCTRFTFTYAANPNTTTRSSTLTFVARTGGGATSSVSLTKTQAGQIVQTGSLSLPGVAAQANTAGSVSIPITAQDVTLSTIRATGALGWSTSQEIVLSGGAASLKVTYPANTASAARTLTLTIEGTDTWGHTLTATTTLSQNGTTAPTRKIEAEWNTSVGSDGVLDYKAGTEKIAVTYTGSFSGQSSVTYPALPAGLTITRTSDTVVDVAWSGGNILRGQQIPITISRKGGDNVTYYAVLNLTLRAGGVFPIWEDVFCTIASDEDYEDYEILEDGDILYEGRAFRYPDEEDISVNVSRVVAPYLTTYSKSVSIESEGEERGAYQFVRDYSYDRSVSYLGDVWLSRPINGRVPSGVRLSASWWTLGGVLQVVDGSGAIVVAMSVGEGLAVAEWISGSVGKKYLFGDEAYEVVDACRSVLLKYVNAYGAVDYFLVEGVSKKSDKITRASYEKDAPALSSEYEKKDYQAEMEAQWTGTTGWLTDSQSARMKHLTESVEVYMVCEDGSEVPVVVTLGSQEYKTFRNNGRKMVNYTLTWSESQKKIRR